MPFSAGVREGRRATVGLFARPWVCFIWHSDREEITSRRMPLSEPDAHRVCSDERDNVAKPHAWHAHPQLQQHNAAVLAGKQCGECTTACVNRKPLRMPHTHTHTHTFYILTMAFPQPVDFAGWIASIAHELKPPVGAREHLRTCINPLAWWLTPPSFLGCAIRCRQ